jgi:plasmid stability protein
MQLSLIDVGGIMATLIVRNVDVELVKQLRHKAVEHGRSAEEEHREILRKALAEKRVELPDFKAMLMAIPPGDDDLFQQVEL